MTSLNDILIVDIETAPNSLVKDHVPEFAAPANYKDPAKIARYVEEKQMEFVDKAPRHQANEKRRQNVYMGF